MSAIFHQWDFFRQQIQIVHTNRAKIFALVTLIWNGGTRQKSQGKAGLRAGSDRTRQVHSLAYWLRWSASGTIPSRGNSRGGRCGVAEATCRKVPDLPQRAQTDVPFSHSMSGCPIFTFDIAAEMRPALNRRHLFRWIPVLKSWSRQIRAFFTCLRKKRLTSLQCSEDQRTGEA